MTRSFLTRITFYYQNLTEWLLGLPGLYFTYGVEFKIIRTASKAFSDRVECIKVMTRNFAYKYNMENSRSLSKKFYVTRRAVPRVTFSRFNLCIFEMNLCILMNICGHKWHELLLSLRYTITKYLVLRKVFLNIFSELTDSHLLWGTFNKHLRHSSDSDWNEKHPELKHVAIDKHVIIDCKYLNL